MRDRRSQTFSLTSFSFCYVFVSCFSLSVRRFWGKREKLGRPDTQATLVSYHMTLDTSHVLFVTLVFLSWPSMFLGVFVYFLHYSYVSNF